MSGVLREQTKEVRLRPRGHAGIGLACVCWRVVASHPAGWCPACQVDALRAQKIKAELELERALVGCVA